MAFHDLQMMSFIHFFLTVFYSVDFFKIKYSLNNTLCVALPLNAGVIKDYHRIN